MSPRRARASRFYRCTITVKAGYPSILIDEEGNAAVSWTFEVDQGVEPSQARYCAHTTSSPAAGRLPDGIATIGATQARGIDQNDAIVDLVGERAFAPMVFWDHWCSDTGWYWHLYDDRGGDRANVFGSSPARPGESPTCGRARAG